MIQRVDIQELARLDDNAGDSTERSEVSGRSPKNGDTAHGIGGTLPAVAQVLRHGFDGRASFLQRGRAAALLVDCVKKGFAWLDRSRPDRSTPPREPEWGAMTDHVEIFGFVLDAWILL